MFFKFLSFLQKSGGKHKLELLMLDTFKYLKVYNHQSYQKRVISKRVKKEGRQSYWMKQQLHMSVSSVILYRRSLRWVGRVKPVFRYYSKSVLRSSFHNYYYTKIFFFKVQTLLILLLRHEFLYKQLQVFFFNALPRKLYKRSFLRKKYSETANIFKVDSRFGFVPTRNSFLKALECLPEYLLRKKGVILAHSLVCKKQARSQVWSQYFLKTKRIHSRRQKRRIKKCYKIK
jgi:hypothetical protein